MIENIIIKICGITEREIAHFLKDTDVDIMGFIFYPKSPRYITPKQASTIVKSLGKNRKIKIAGVFVNAREDEIKEIFSSVPLDYIQFHGDETPEFLKNFRGYKIIKAFRINKNFSEKEIVKFSSDYFLFDTFRKDLYGGTGEKFDWKKFKFISKFRPFFISGGIKEENVLEAIKIFNPDGIDINSGVEIAPGKKSKEKIKSILLKIRNYMRGFHYGKVAIK